MNSAVTTSSCALYGLKSSWARKANEGLLSLEVFLSVSPLGLRVQKLNTNQQRNQNRGTSPAPPPRVSSVLEGESE